ncbi:hypothetical protein VKT23_013175 [Stygiomarasmius scandens]|uniref:Uncharacterized protein n=1 Tax=Marasmiellus scandens TaxID=2682957 RepID=A0ABR1J6K8_9AGAR
MSGHSSVPPISPNQQWSLLQKASPSPIVPSNSGSFVDFQNVTPERRPATGRETQAAATEAWHYGRRNTSDRMCQESCIA